MSAALAFARERFGKIQRKCCSTSSRWKGSVDDALADWASQLQSLLSGDRQRGCLMSGYLMAHSSISNCKHILYLNPGLLTATEVRSR